MHEDGNAVGLFGSAEGRPCHGGVSHCCVCGWQPQPVARGSQLSAGHSWAGLAAGDTQTQLLGRHSSQSTLTPHSLDWAAGRGRTEDRALYSVCKHTFHSANKLLPKPHLTGCRVIAVGAVPEFGRQEWLCPSDNQGAPPSHTVVSPLFCTGRLIKQQININCYAFYWHNHLILVLHKALEGFPLMHFSHEREFCWYCPLLGLHWFLF